MLKHKLLKRGKFTNNKLFNQKIVPVIFSFSGYSALSPLTSLSMDFVLR